LFENRVYNVLTENATVEDVLGILRRHAPALSVDFVDSAAMNAWSYTVARARFEALGFGFQGSLEDGIRDTVDLLRNARAGARDL
jgi:nucleoside-diphosphate-sugar epimerase